MIYKIFSENLGRGGGAVALEAVNCPNKDKREGGYSARFGCLHPYRAIGLAESSFGQAFL